MASNVSYGRVALTVIGGIPGKEIGVVTGIPGILGCVIAVDKTSESTKQDPHNLPTVLPFHCQ